jgi:FkbM family methyltransferase
MRPHSHVLPLIRAFMVFRNPFAVIFHYVTRTSPRSGQVKLRDGHVIHLSGHPSDVATVFVVFARKEYGDVPPRAVVIDVGANIGAFTIYAARQGAKRIYACEPSEGNYAVLKKNVKDNHYDEIVRPMMLFVAGDRGRKIRFPKKSSPFNFAILENPNKEFAELSTVTLDDVVHGENLAIIDFIKMDCETCEYSIIFDGQNDIWKKTEEIRMEYHRGRLDEITIFFDALGFSMIKNNVFSAIHGIVWFRRTMHAATKSM